MRAISGLWLACAIGAAAPVHAASEWIYIQKRPDGVPHYTDQKPKRGSFQRVHAHGRETAKASCSGLTQTSMKQRAQSYAPLIEKHAKAHGLSPQLVSAVMRVESCYDHRAVSRAGARGLMQLMPGTAKQLGVKDSFDPDQNIAGGARYLSQMLQRFGQDVKLALAAYNAGPEAVATYGRIPPYPETQSYVKRILKLYTPSA